MKESYVSYEIARKLKECGFDWKTNEYYTHKHNDYPYRQDVPADHNTNDFGAEELCSASSLSLAQKWLREVKGIIVWISSEFYEGDSLDDVHWYFHAQPLSDLRKSKGGMIRWFNSHESALSAGIDAALKILEEKL